MLLLLHLRPFFCTLAVKHQAVAAPASCVSRFKAAPAANYFNVLRAIKCRQQRVVLPPPAAGRRTLSGGLAQISERRPKARRLVVLRAGVPLKVATRRGVAATKFQYFMAALALEGRLGKSRGKGWAAMASGNAARNVRRA